MSFDSKKPHGTIHGVYAACPQARYEQGGKLYDVRYQEVKAGDLLKAAPASAPVVPAPAPAPVAPAAPAAPQATQHVPVPDPEADALAAEIAEVKVKLVEAEVKSKASPTPSNRAAATRLTNKLKKLEA
jgi:hypothetical protein